MPLSNLNRKVGTRINSALNGDSLILNYGLTSSVTFTFVQDSPVELSFTLPPADGATGDVMVTDGAGNLSFQTVAGGLTYASGSTPSLTKWTGSQSIGNSVVEEVGNQLFFPSGVAAQPGITFLTDGDTGIYRVAANTLGVAAGGTLVASHTTTEHYFNTTTGQIYMSSGAGINLNDPINGTIVTGSFSNTNVNASEVVITDANGYFISTPISGFAGPTGIQGPTGPTGSTGAQGIQGTTGSNGAQGIQGIQGEMGNTGSQGIQGIQGPSGTTASGLFAQRSGEVMGASFSGSPLSYNVVFSSFTSSYVVTLDSPDPRDWTVSNKGLTGFSINSNSITAMTVSTYWSAVSLINDDLASLVGAQGIQGIQGPTGGIGIQGVQGIQGATGTNGTNGTNGAAGAQGATGATGATGASGPEYSSSVQAGVSVIAFTSSRIYNTFGAPSTSNLTDNLTSAVYGIVQKIYSQKSPEPTYPAGWVNIGTGAYSLSAVNIIYAEWSGGTRVEYWIVQ